MSGADRTLLVDASVFITLAETGYAELLAALEGTVVVPVAVREEIEDDPGASRLEAATEAGWLRSASPDASDLRRAAEHLGRADRDGDVGGDVALLAAAFGRSDPVVVVTDDTPLRTACTALGIEVSGSIGLLVVAVENGELAADEATEALAAMDEVGARLSASLLRRAEALIDEASGTD